MAAHDVFGEEGVGIGMVAGLPVEEVTRRLAVALRTGEACQRALAFYLREVEARRLYQLLGFASTVQFAIQRLRLSRGQARDLLRAGRRLEELPELDAAFARGELPWSKVRRIARVAIPGNERQWIERCLDLSAEQVDGLVASVREGDDPPSLDQGLPHARFVLRFHVNLLEHEMFEQARAKLAAELGRTVTDDELLGDLVRLFLSSDADGSVPGRRKVDGSLFRVVVQGEGAAAGGEPGAVAVAQDQLAMLHAQATLPKRVRRRILRRDGHRCRHCGSQRHPMIHHVEWRSWGGRHDDRNLVTLCGRCHGLVHERLLLVSRRADGVMGFTDRDGRSLRAPLRAKEVHVGTCAAAAGSAAALAADGDRAPAHLEAHEVPDVVDGEWWRKHEHCFEWTRDGRGVRLRKRRGSGRR